MFNWLTKRAHPKRVSRTLYERIVAQSRLPAFYVELGVPDTLEGRFEILALHVFLGLERLRAEGAEAEAVAQHLVDAFCADMDDTMRELGVGDMSVSKHVRNATAALYTRLNAYRAASEAGAKELAVAVRRFVFSDAADARADVLAAYAMDNLKAPAVPAQGLAHDGTITFRPIGAGGNAGHGGAINA